jgi:hypothetical protein
MGHLDPFTQDEEVLSLHDKHDFGPGHLGFGFSLMRHTLTELRMWRCCGLVSQDPGLW